ncbi:MAG: hypothetical protein U1E77_11610 [Inhella sp.]
MPPGAPPGPHTAAAPPPLAAGACGQRPGAGGHGLHADLAVAAPGGLLVREEQGQAQGVPVTLGQALQRRLHCPVSTELMPQQRLIKASTKTSRRTC